MRYLMGNQRIIVHMLMFISYHAPITLALCTLTRESQIELITGDTIMKGNHIVIDTTVTLLVDIDIADTYILMMRLFQTVKVE